MGCAAFVESKNSFALAARNFTLTILTRATTRRLRLPDHGDESNVSVDDDIFDINEDEHFGSETDAIDVEDYGNDVDIEDQIRLFGGNLHPPKYY